MRRDANWDHDSKPENNLFIIPIFIDRQSEIVDVCLGMDYNEI